MGPFAHAEGASITQVHTETDRSSSGASAQTVFLSASLSEGISSLHDPVANAGDSGSQLELLGLASFVTPAWVFEAGGGWFHSSIVDGIGFQLTTDAAVAEVSPQYRVTEHLQFGPLAEALFGEDVGFRPGFQDSGRRWAFLGGGQALYEMRVAGMAFRPGARYLTSFCGPEQRLQAIQATVQLGLPVF